MAMGNKALLRVDAKWAQSRDSYYQQQDFSAQDTADATEFSYLTTGLSVERNSLNRKQQPNRGELLQVSLRYIGGLERTRPGSLSAWQGDYTGRHDWVILKAVLDKYFLRKGPFRFGFLAEGVYSTQPFFQNYTGTLLQMPVFQPTPESKTYFLENYRAPQY